MSSYDRYSQGDSHGNEYREVHYNRGGGGKGDGKQSLCGACFCSMAGVLLFFGCLAGIAMNEVSTVCVSKALGQAGTNYEEVQCSNDKSNGGQLAYFACPVGDRSFQSFTPQSFSGAQWLDGAFSERAVKLSQQVSMFQCVEHKREKTEKASRNHGGGKGGGNKDTVTVVYWEYNLEWKGSHVNDKQFKAWDNREAWRALTNGCGDDFKGNPQFPMQAQTLSADTLIAGDYDITRHLEKVSVNVPVNLNQGSYSSPVRASSSSRSGSSNRRIARDGQPYTRGGFIDFYGQEKGEQEWDYARPEQGGGGSVDVHGNTVQTCTGQLGCLKVSYFKSSMTHVSHMASLNKLTSGTKAWAAEPSWMCSSSSGSSKVDLFAEGVISADELVANAQSSNTAETWMIRGVCFFLVIAGVYMFLQPIQAIADMIDQFLDWFKFIPILGWGLDFLGDVVSGAVGCAIFLISVGIGAPSAFAVMSISWLVMRPIVGVPMVFACGAFIAMTVKTMADYAKIGRAKRQKSS